MVVVVKEIFQRLAIAVTTTYWLGFAAVGQKRETITPLRTDTCHSHLH